MLNSEKKITKIKTKTKEHLLQNHLLFEQNSIKENSKKKKKEE